MKQMAVHRVAPLPGEFCMVNADPLLESHNFLRLSYILDPPLYDEAIQRLQAVLMDANRKDIN